MNRFSLFTVCFLVYFPTTIFASGFQIPNQSITAVGIAGAHIAFTPGPDSAYYNPANMSFLNDSWQMETSLTSLYLPSIEYSDRRSSLLNGSSDSELFFLPQIHINSGNYNNFRFGFALTYPYGLAKSWTQPFPAVTSRKFSLIVVEANPTFAYSLFNNFSIGGGVRFIYSEGEVDSIATSPPFNQLEPLTTLSRDLDGDDTEIGYNLAATFRPTEEWALAITYRSEVELQLQGNTSLQALAGQSTIMSYRGPGSLEVSLPAVFSMATSYSFEALTLEIAWNRTFWSSFKELDFQYDINFMGTPFDAFDRPTPKSWDDSDAIRFGITYDFNEKLTTTLGFAFDQTPVPESTLGFELPDSDALMYSCGIQYQQSENLKIGMSYMYQHTKSRTVTNRSSTGFAGVDGTFTEGGAHAVNIGVIYTF